MVTLSQAIADVEAASTALSNAQTSQQAAQTKFDAAKSAKDSADQANADAVTAFNSSLDEIVAAAQAAKIPVGPAAPAV